MPNNMKLIMENWNRFLINEEDPMDQINKDLKSGEDALERVKEIADKRGIKSYSYVNGKIGGVQLTKAEIEYIETGKKSSSGYVNLGSIYMERSGPIFKLAVKQKNPNIKIKFAVLSYSLKIFSLLHPLKPVPNTAEKIKSQIAGWLKHPAGKIDKAVAQKVLGLIDNAIKNATPVYEDEQIAKVLGIPNFEATRKIYEKTKK